MVVCPACLYRDDPPDREWTVRIKRKLKSLNEVGSNGRGPSGRKYRTTRRALKVALGAASREVPKADGHRQVVITRQYGSKSGGKDGRCEYDYDNLVGGSKPLIDALRELKLVLNDHPGVMNAVYRQEPSGSVDSYIQIQLQEFDNDC